MTNARRADPNAATALSAPCSVTRRTTARVDRLCADSLVTDSWALAFWFGLDNAGQDRADEEQTARLAGAPCPDTGDTLCGCALCLDMIRLASHAARLARQTAPSERTTPGAWERARRWVRRVAGV